jgi:hypothetical protein
VTAGLLGADAPEMKVDAEAVVAKARTRSLNGYIVGGYLLFGVGSGCRG